MSAAAARVAAARACATTAAVHKCLPHVSVHLPRVSPLTVRRSVATSARQFSSCVYTPAHCTPNLRTPASASTMAAATTTGVGASLYGTAFPAVPRTETAASLTSGPAPAFTPDVTVHLLTKEDAKTWADSPLAAADAEREAVSVHYKGDARAFVVSVGSAGSVTVESIRKGVVAAVNKAKALKLKSVAFAALPAAKNGGSVRVVETVVQAALLTNYHFDRYVLALHALLVSRVRVACPVIRALLDTPLQLPDNGGEGAQLGDAVPHHHSGGFCRRERGSGNCHHAGQCHRLCA